jgi:hypothetical protein
MGIRLSAGQLRALRHLAGHSAYGGHSTGESTVNKRAAVSLHKLGFVTRGVRATHRDLDVIFTITPKGREWLEENNS